MADMPPDVEARMQAWQKYGAPGPEHKILDVLEGRWKAVVKSYMAPGGPPMESRGEAEFERVLGGNYVEQRFRGDMGGTPFEGRGHVGYDRYKGEYFQTWMDSMSTALLTMTGQVDPTGRVLAFTGPMTDPVTGQTQTLRQTLRITPERLEMEMYGPDPEGREARMMDIIYVRY